MALALGQCLGHPVAAQRLIEQAVDHQSLVADALVGQLATGTPGLAQRASVRAADQHERGALRIAKLRDRGLILLALRLEPRPRPETACALPACLDVVSPGAGQVHQPQRVTGRGGVEDHMVIAARQLRMDDQLRELVKGGHLDGALASKPLLDLADLPRGGHATVGADHPLAIGSRRGVGSRFITDTPGAPGTVVTDAPTATPNTSARFDAGSVLTTSTRRPASPSATAAALASVVFPTPPLPVKNRNGVLHDNQSRRFSERDAIRPIALPADP